MDSSGTDNSMMCGRCQKRAVTLFMFSYDDGSLGDHYCRKCFAGVLSTVSDDLFAKVRGVNTLRRGRHVYR